MIEELREAVNGPFEVNLPWASASLAGLIASPSGAVWVSDDGFLAAAIAPTVINPAPVAQELGWYARGGSGLRLLKAFEAWAEDMGAVAVQLSTGVSGPDLSRLGYRPAEQAWVRKL